MRRVIDMVLGMLWTIVVILVVIIVIVILLKLVFAIIAIGPYRNGRTTARITSNN